MDVAYNRNAHPGQMVLLPWRSSYLLRNANTSCTCHVIVAASECFSKNRPLLDPGALDLQALLPSIELLRQYAPQCIFCNLALGCVVQRWTAVLKRLEYPDISCALAFRI